MYITAYPLKLDYIINNNNINTYILQFIVTSEVVIA